MTYLDYLFRDSRHVELRQQVNGRWKSYWFDDADKLIHKADQLAGSGNLFTSLHHVTDIPDGPLRNEHVSRLTRLFFDFDPVRLSGTASTAEELAFAIKRAAVLQEALRAWGFPEPLTALSGNGYHLQYRISLPNDSATGQMLATIYRGMAKEFSCQQVSFDASVRNPGRICTLYGRVKRKGENTPERPHRRSEVVIPGPWNAVTMTQVESVANHYARQQKTAEANRPNFNRKVVGRGDYRTLDIVAWFTAHGLYEHAIEGNMHAVTCPWEAEHSEHNSNDTMIFESDGGWPGFFCHHSHCEGRKINDVIRFLGDVDVFCGSEFGGVA